MPLLITRIVVCPYCRARVNLYAKECPQCNESLSLMRDLLLLPYALYNQALERFNEGDYCGALLKVSAAVELSKEFEEARVLLTKIGSVLGLKELNGNGHAEFVTCATPETQDS